MMSATAVGGNRKASIHDRNELEINVSGKCFVGEHRGEVFVNGSC